MLIALDFAPSHNKAQRARLEYTLRIFCAILGHKPILANGCTSCADIVISYNPPAVNAAPTLQLSNLYCARELSIPAPPPVVFKRGAKETMLHYSPQPECEPDWLGEIFEWVSCADEYSVQQRDSIGRIPFSASYFGRHKLDPRVPYAAVAMRFLEDSIAKLVPQCQANPQQSAQHAIVNTHDVDFLPLGRITSSRRLAKSAAISLLLSRAPVLAAMQTARTLALAFGGSNALDQIQSVTCREAEHSSGSSFYFVCRNLHRRDTNYDIHSPAVIRLMRQLEQDGFEIGVHGSYCSLDDADGLALEFDSLRALGFRPLGGRIHWLRFTLPQLIHATERAGAKYDCSLGWADVIGYRAGACFAFPPYDFDRERAAGFLELPLAIMDQAVVKDLECTGSRSVTESLRASRRLGLGGASVLWHPTAFGGGQLPVRVGEAFWRLLRDSSWHNDAFVSASSFVNSAWHRYAKAGLLPAGGIQ